MTQFLNFLREDLNKFIADKIGTTGEFVLFSNFNNITDATTGVDNKIIASIVNLDEEKMLKNSDNFGKLSGDIAHNLPPVWMNVTCLFAFYTRSNDSYDGLDILAYVVQYFHSKPILGKTTAIVPENYPQDMPEIRSEFISLNYEQTNYLWGIFGGRYHPSVIYKFRAIPIGILDGEE